MILEIEHSVLLETVTSVTYQLAALNFGLLNLFLSSSIALPFRSKIIRGFRSIVRFSSKNSIALTRNWQPCMTDERMRI